MAAEPGITSAGAGTDALGRSGLTIRWNFGGNRTGEMIIDPAGPQILASHGDGRPTADSRHIVSVVSTLVVTAAWTDETPTAPTP